MLTLKCLNKQFQAFVVIQNVKTNKCNAKEFNHLVYVQFDGNYNLSKTSLNSIPLKQNISLISYPKKHFKQNWKNVPKIIN